MACCMIRRASASELTVASYFPGAFTPRTWSASVGMAGFLGVVALAVVDQGRTALRLVANLRASPIRAAIARTGPCGRRFAGA